MRECGDCSLCCTLLGVKELEKKANERCGNNVHGCCAIYEQRPISCGEFSCLWLQGKLPLEMKPNLCHVVVGGMSDSSGLILYVDSDYPDADKAYPVAGMIEDAKRKLEVIIATGQKRVIFMQQAQA